MSQHVGIADGLRSKSAEQLATTAGGIIAGLTGDPAFPTPPIELEAVQTAVDELKAALSAQALGGTAATAEKRNKKEALIMMLRKLRRYVEDSCGNDATILLSSGFQAAVATRIRRPLENPSILKVDRGNCGELMLKVTPIALARCYEVRLAAVGAENAPGPWQSAGMFTSSRSMTVAGLVPGTTYSLQVRAVGGSTRYSDWSNAVSRMCR